MMATMAIYNPLYMTKLYICILIYMIITAHYIRDRDLVGVRWDVVGAWQKKAQQMEASAEEDVDRPNNNTQS
jgi:hypothetical protein